MSSDLLSAFGEGGKSPRPQAQTKNPAHDLDLEIDREDDFGDFEDAQNDVEDFSQVKSEHSQSLFEAFQLPNEPRNVEHTGWNQSGDVLQEGRLTVADDEEFGVFVREEVLLFDADQHQEKQEHKAQPQISSNSFEFDVDSDDDWNPVEVAHIPIVPDKIQASGMMLDYTKPVAVDAPRSPKQEDHGPAPTNVPPPSVLLAVITNIFQTLATRIKDVVPLDRSTSAPHKLIDDMDIAQLQKQLSILRAGARIIAGRRIRWKRDKILSQSMKIGAAGQRGMKLSSIDRNETRREDQEVAEVVHLWKKQIGSLRSMIAKVNASLTGDDLILPDITETIPIRQGKPSEGAIKAPKSCFLCGIMRDERVAKVDLFVEDSFGEWWIEHWGHVDCVTAWGGFQDYLTHR